MIISEKQIMQLINICRDFMVILSHSAQESAANKYNHIASVIDEITHQQSEELKDCKNYETE